MSSAPAAPASSAELDRLLDSFPDIPTIPEVLVRIWKIVDDPDSSAKDLEEAVAMEASLAAKVLRLANSAYFGGRGRIADVRTAITTLGFDTIRNLAVCLTVANRLAASPNEDRTLNRRELWRHSVATAVLARSTARSLQIPGADEAFTAGLLHDIGKFVISLGRAGGYAEIVRRAEAEGLPILAAEKIVLGFDHAELGAAFAARWNFPSSLVEILAGHHRLADGRDLRAVVSFANRLSYELQEFQVLPNVVVMGPQPADRAALGLDESWIESRVEGLVEEIEAAHEFMNLV